ncbi:MAG: metal ABC transporter ATP-binding protein [Lachnobacterium sp.]|nr:metal ABC transporter ATP-binding protein [Lachnobacterium sp.]
MSYIECNDLSLGYDGKSIISGLNIKINKGDYLCILGENGVGKSTLIKTLLGLQSPIDGEIVFDDGLKQYEIGYLPQQTRIQQEFPATVWEVVLTGTLKKEKWNLFYSKQQKELAKSKLEELGIWNLRKKSYRNLSGGQQQRVLLARALCATTKVILLDEPVTGLDPIVTKEFYKLLKQINKKGITVIMVSHDMSVVEYASHVLFLSREKTYFTEKKSNMTDEMWIDVISKGVVQC